VFVPNIGLKNQALHGPNTKVLVRRRKVNQMELLDFLKPRAITEMGSQDLWRILFVTLLAQNQISAPGCVV
jgi:hypothetical protein